MFSPFRFASKIAAAYLLIIQAAQAQTDASIVRRVQQEPVIELNGQNLSCQNFAATLDKFSDPYTHLAERPLADYAVSEIEDIRRAVDACTPLADQLATMFTPEARQLRQQLGILRSRRSSIEAKYSQARNEIELEQQREEQRRAEAERKQQGEEVAAAERAKAERERQEQSRRDADIKRRAYEVDRAEWSADSRLLAATVEGEKTKPPSQDEPSVDRERRQKAITQARRVVSTSVWKKLSAEHPDVRDFTIMLDPGPVAKVGEFMSCFEINQARPNWPLKLTDGAIAFNPPIIGKLGRYDVTITGGVGPGNKPLKWVMYLKKVDDHFYVDEITENGKRLAGLPAIIQSSGFLLVANCSVN